LENIYAKINSNLIVVTANLRIKTRRSEELTLNLMIEKEEK
jgi:hypothetical protein